MPLGPNQQDAHRKRPLAYFITFRTYGTWLHGNPSGSVDRRHRQFGAPLLGADPERLADSQDRMKHTTVSLDDRQRAIVENTLHEVCVHRGWQLHERNVRTNHVHLVVNADAPPEQVMHDLKAYATRRLRESGLISKDTKVWSRHGSTRYLWRERHVALACEYVRDGQGSELPTDLDGREPAPG